MYCSGLDFHVAADLNFLQRHLKSAGKAPAFEYKAAYFISAKQVATVEARILDARRQGTRANRASGPKNSKPGHVPDEAIDCCEDSHEAADHTRHKANSAEFDDKGLAACVCRHDIPLCVINVDTPGESQKYVLTMIEWLFEQLPPNATVGFVYDIGCVLDRSCNKVSTHTQCDIR
jgi:hypothetical protein